MSLTPSPGGMLAIRGDWRGRFFVPRAPIEQRKSARGNIGPSDRVCEPRWHAAFLRVPVNEVPTKMNCAFVSITLGILVSACGDRSSGAPAPSDTSQLQAAAPSQA